MKRSLQPILGRNPWRFAPNMLRLIEGAAMVALCLPARLSPWGPRFRDGGPVANETERKTDIHRRQCDE
jgi:hypothetical protein